MREMFPGQTKWEIEHPNEKSAREVIYYLPSYNRLFQSAVTRRPLDEAWPRNIIVHVSPALCFSSLELTNQVLQPPCGELLILQLRSNGRELNPPRGEPESQCGMRQRQKHEC